jgi:hypothetical protein
LQINLLNEAAAWSAAWLNGFVSLILLGLALVLVFYAVRAWRELDRSKLPVARITERD